VAPTVAATAAAAAPPISARLVSGPPALQHLPSQHFWPLQHLPPQHVWPELQHAALAPSLLMQHVWSEPQQVAPQAALPDGHPTCAAGAAKAQAALLKPK